jgi:hypothetical protein
MKYGPGSIVPCLNMPCLCHLHFDSESVIHHHEFMKYDKNDVFCMGGRMGVPHGRAAWACRMGVPHGRAAWACRMGVPHGRAAWASHTSNTICVDLGPN